LNKSLGLVNHPLKSCAFDTSKIEITHYNYNPIHENAKLSTYSDGHRSFSTQFVQFLTELIRSDPICSEKWEGIGSD